MRIIGLDYGTKTVGVALSDALGITAQPVETITRKEENKLRKTYARIEAIIEENDVEKIVVGLPKNMNNTIGPKGELSLSFKKKLEDRLDIPVYLQDERLTTREAEAVLISNNTRRNNRKKVIDSLAATIILQSYLDKEKKL